MRSLKLALRSAPAKLCKRGGFLAFRSESRTFRGLTRPLAELYSAADPPTDAEWRGAWRGAGGGRRRGTAVDRQIARVINGQGAATFCLTKLVMAALKRHSLRAVCAQRVVADERTGIASAVDILARDGDSLVLVELKTGYPGDRTRPACKGGKPLNMKQPLHKAKDTTANRHLAQLSATLEMFSNEVKTFERLQACGITKVVAALLYVDSSGSEVFVLPDWWVRRGRAILNAL